jgi:predicted amidohydrolase
LIILPELFTCGYAALDLRPWSEKAQSRTFRTFATLADELNAVVGWGFAEPSESRKVYNSFALIEPGGRLSIVRKTHLHISTSGTRVNEPEFLLPGDRLGIVNTRIGRLGVMICYDGCFVEVPRSLVLQGADCILWPSRSGGYLAGTGLPRIRAIDNIVPIVQIEGAQTGGQCPLPQHSQVFDHVGELLAETQKDGELLRVSLDLAEVRRFRATAVGVCAQYRVRRPELYGPISNRALPAERL